jgi:putative endonuclease
MIKKTSSSKQLGKQGENTACRLLCDRGLEIIHENFRTRTGEIDIIALDKDIVVFVEVKVRRSLKTGTPEESIDNKKQAQIRKTAEIFLAQRGWMEREVRFDVIALEFSTGENKWKARWIKKAF